MRILLPVSLTSLALVRNSGRTSRICTSHAGSSKRSARASRRCRLPKTNALTHKPRRDGVELHQRRLPSCHDPTPGHELQLCSLTSESHRFHLSEEQSLPHSSLASTDAQRSRSWEDSVLRASRLRGWDDLGFRATGDEDFEELGSVGLRVWACVCMPSRRLAIVSRWRNLPCSVPCYAIILGPESDIGILIRFKTAHTGSVRYRRYGEGIGRLAQPQGRLGDPHGHREQPKSHLPEGDSGIRARCVLSRICRGDEGRPLSYSNAMSKLGFSVWSHASDKMVPVEWIV